MINKLQQKFKGNIIEKVNRKIRKKWVSILRNTNIYKYCYKSYWHYLKCKFLHDSSVKKTDLYFTAMPNPGAGIGHQVSNWIAGYHYAKTFHLKYAYLPFSSKQWDSFLGFDQNEENVKNLRKKGFSIVRIQLFNENNPEEMSRIRNIIHSYSCKKVIFLAEQDQFYRNLYTEGKELQKKFFMNKLRSQEKLIYSNSTYNIAVHVRRGDIVQIGAKTNPNLTMRFQSNYYFINAIKTALNIIQTKKDIHIFVFSQGREEEFEDFLQFENIHFCFDMTAQDSFLHMVYADTIITSKSSFSYKPALLNQGLKFSPSNFWHGYPNDPSWILLDDDGQLCK